MRADWLRADWLRADWLRADWLRADVRPSLVETPVAGVLATIAFLVVFSVLIKDFF